MALDVTKFLSVTKGGPPPSKVPLLSPKKTDQIEEWMMQHPEEADQEVINRFQKKWQANPESVKLVVDDVAQSPRLRVLRKGLETPSEGPIRATGRFLAETVNRELPGEMIRPLTSAPGRAVRAVGEFLEKPAEGREPPRDGVLEQGNIDLSSRPTVLNEDGTTSTIRSISIREEDKEVLIPTISPEGQQLSDDEAIELYRTSGQHLGKFDSPESATTFAKALSRQQGQQVSSVGDILPDVLKRAKQSNMWAPPQTDADVKEVRGLQTASANLKERNAELEAEASELDEHLTRMNSLLNLGKVAEYNAGVGEYNQKVNQFQKKMDAFNLDVGAFTSRAEKQFAAQEQRRTPVSDEDLEDLLVWQMTPAPTARGDAPEMLPSPDTWRSGEAYDKWVEENKPHWTKEQKRAARFVVLDSLSRQAIAQTYGSYSEAEKWLLGTEIEDDLSTWEKFKAIPSETARGVVMLINGGVLPNASPSEYNRAANSMALDLPNFIGQLLLMWQVTGGAGIGIPGVGGRAPHAMSRGLAGTRYGEFVTRAGTGGVGERIVARAAVSAPELAAEFGALRMITDAPTPSAAAKGALEGTALAVGLAGPVELYYVLKASMPAIRIAGTNIRTGGSARKALSTARREWKKVLEMDAVIYPDGPDVPVLRPNATRAQRRAYERAVRSTNDVHKLTGAPLPPRGTMPEGIRTPAHRPVRGVLPARTGEVPPAAPPAAEARPMPPPATEGARPMPAGEGPPARAITPTAPTEPAPSPTGAPAGALTSTEYGALRQRSPAEAVGYSFDSGTQLWIPPEGVAVATEAVPAVEEAAVVTPEEAAANVVEAWNEVEVHAQAMDMEAKDLLTDFGVSPPADLSEGLKTALATHQTALAEAKQAYADAGRSDEDLFADVQRLRKPEEVTPAVEAAEPEGGFMKAAEEFAEVDDGVLEAEAEEIGHRPPETIQAELEAARAQKQTLTEAETPDTAAIEQANAEVQRLGVQKSPLQKFRRNLLPRP
jgi:hypothetical protein